MNLEQIIAKQEEELREKSNDWLWGFIPDGFGEETNAYISEALHFDKLVTWHRYSIKEILEWVVEIIEKEKVSCNLCENKEIHDTDKVNQALDTIISKIK